MEWDASIDLVVAHLEPGERDHARAVEAVRRAVEGLPGAGWVSVAWCGALPAVRWLTLYKRNSCLAADGPEWDRVRRAVERTVAAVLA